MSPAEFASSLAEAVAPIVPKEVRVYRSGSAVAVDTALPRGAAYVNLEGFFAPRGDREGMSNAALAVLGHVQDQIVEALRSGWPGEAAQLSGDQLPLPYAIVSDDTLLLGYERDDVQFPLGSISLTRAAA